MNSYCGGLVLDSFREKLVCVRNTRLGMLWPPLGESTHHQYRQEVQRGARLLHMDHYQMLSADKRSKGECLSFCVYEAGNLLPLSLRLRKGHLT